MDIEKEIAYIYSYIKYAFFGVEELKDNKFLLDMTRRIKNNMPNSIFCTGNYDFIINNFVSKEMQLRDSKSYNKFASLRNHMYLVISYYRLNVDPEIDNYQIILNELTRYAYNNFNYEDIIEGKCDEDLEKIIPRLTNTFVPLDKLENVYMDLTHIAINDDEIVDDRTFITKYIKDYLNKYINIFDFDGDIDYLSDLICNELLRLNIRCDDILSHDYDSIIDSFLIKEKFGIELKDEFKKMEMEVSKYVLSYNTYMELDNQGENISKIIFKITKQLRDQGNSISDIASGKCDTLIEKYMRIDCIMANSKVSKIDKYDKIPLKKNKILQSDKLKASLLTLAITVLAVGVSIGTVESTKASNLTLDEYNYPTISYEMSEEFAETLEHVIENYNKYEEYGEYGQIYLYKSFESMKGEPFNMMDSMLELMKERTKHNPNLGSLQEDIEGRVSYIEYVFEHLILQNPELNNKKNIEAVREYNSQVGNYKELNAYRLLSKDTQRILNDIMREYGKYISSLEQELQGKVNEESRSK